MVASLNHLFCNRRPCKYLKIKCNEDANRSCFKGTFTT